MKNIKIILIAISLIFVSGCVQKGNPRIGDKSFTNKIQQNITTKDDIKEWFGESNGSGFSNGKKYWVYNYYYFNVSPIPGNVAYVGTNEKRVRMKIYFNKKNKVSEYSIENRIGQLE